ncbi:hypothetical protein ACFL5Q_01765 [Planctomycetota bacterium]
MFRRRRRAAGSQAGGEMPPSRPAEWTGPSLYEDWLARREQLAGARASLGQHGEMMIQVLDYFITRYRDSPVAARPARFALRSGLVVNERAILVHHHLKPIEGGTVKSPQEAERRMAAMVERMTSCSEADDIDDADGGPGFAESLDLAAGEGRYGVDLARLRETRRELNRAMAEWRQCLEDGEIERARETLEPFVRRRQLRRLVAQRIRPELAHRDAAVRLAAITILGRVGEPEDLGLLADLLTLPRQCDEHPHERATLARAVERISRSGEDR